MKDNKQKLIVIGGPTASGKSSLAVELAQHFRGEVLNADSMQVYRGMDVGTAKPSMEERRGINHHLLDVVDPDEDSLYKSITGRTHGLPALGAGIQGKNAGGM
jgi:tRNA dimethylallyltransferase